MARIGITGHANLTDDTAALVAAAIRSLLAGHSPDGMIGVTCLARGADQVFARVVLSTVESMVAVWDGGPSGGYGGTADVVDATRALGVPVTVVWPDGAKRVS